MKNISLRGLTLHVLQKTYWPKTFIGGEGREEGKKNEEDQVFMIQDWLIENKVTSFLKFCSNRVI